jgi:hypothetical protein
MFARNVLEVAELIRSDKGIDMNVEERLETLQYPQNA